ncbi:MAG TPA: HEAT repeat domain-containing protein [Vicinamibacterales bacterium]|nr:HEAT repeat domain-containing protein [Vicinamibacterales bacterium]
MTQVPQLSPELARGVSSFARALIAAARTWTLYPPEHPAVGAAVDRLAEAIAQVTAGAIFSIAATPDALLVEGAAPAGRELHVADAAALLHDRDILHLTFAGHVPLPALRSLLALLALDAAARRARGGPAAIWAADGDPSVTIEQIDYLRVLEDREPPPDTRRRDDVWRAIARTIIEGRTVFDERAQLRLLEIAGDPDEIVDLAAAVMAPMHASDGSPMITTQAATVLAAFRRLSSIVSVMAADQMSSLMRNLSEAASRLAPHVVMQIMRSADEPGEALSVVGGLAGAFDDVQVARLLAAALATEGQATERLAEVFNTIAPDPERRRRVLTMTRSLLHESDFGRTGQFQVLWSSMEELLLSYDESPYVSDSYRAVLDGSGRRARAMAARDLPPELPAWLETLGQDNVRRLSVTLLIDLLHLENQTDRAAEVARDMAGLAEDLVLSGDYDDAGRVAAALAETIANEAGGGPLREAARRALDDLADSIALREMAGLVEELDEAQMAAVGALCRAIGPATVESLRDVAAAETPGPGARRAADLIVAFGAGAVPRLAPLAADRRWQVQVALAGLLGRLASPAGVPYLQGLVRGGHPQVARAAVTALADIDDPSAARALHTVLRAATGDVRQAVIDALVSDPDPRLVPLIVRILAESQPLGRDHDVVLQALGALGAAGSDRAVPAVTAVMQARSLFARRKTRVLAETAVGTLVRIASPSAQAALDHAGVSGHRALRRAARAARPRAVPGAAAS